MSEIQITYGLNSKKLKKGKEVPFARVRGLRAQAVLKMMGGEDQAAAESLQDLTVKVKDAINLVNSVSPDGNLPITKTMIDYHSNIPLGYRAKINQMHRDGLDRPEKNHGYENLIGIN